MINFLNNDLFDLDEFTNAMHKLSNCKCGNEKQHWYDELCWKCKDKQKADKKNEYLANRKRLSLEERISKIEEWIYNHSQNHPVKEFIMR